MRAIVRSNYGTPDVLQLAEIPKPPVSDDTILVRVRAVGLNASDTEILRAEPLYVRFSGYGLWKPKVRVLGSDVAGRVEAVGGNVTEFAPGDEVVGDLLYSGFGGLAEYVAVPEDAPLVHKPSDLTFEAAAALPQAGLIALQGLRDRTRVEAGERVLIIGAGGSAGSFAVQLAKRLGAHVTGVDSGAKLDFMRSLGADEVLDYRRDDFAAEREGYDVILDLAGRRSIFDCRRALRPRGRYGMVGGPTMRIAQAVVLGRLLSLLGSRELGLLVMRPNKADLSTMIELVQSGDVVPAIDRRYPLEEAAEAFRYAGAGGAEGKVVVTV